VDHIPQQVITFCWIFPISLAAFWVPVLSWRAIRHRPLWGWPKDDRVPTENVPIQAPLMLPRFGTVMPNDIIKRLVALERVINTGFLPGEPDEGGESDGGAVREPRPDPSKPSSGGATITRSTTGGIVHGYPAVMQGPGGFINLETNSLHLAIDDTEPEAQAS
jgi:hypothetical protein